MTMIFSAWTALIFFFKVAVVVGRHLGLEIVDGEEIPFYPFRFLISYTSSFKGSVYLESRFPEVPMKERLTSSFPMDSTQT